MNEYKITEEDVESMLRFLRLNFPNCATPETAVKVLEQLQIGQERLEKFDSDAIEAILKDLEDH